MIQEPQQPEMIELPTVELMTTEQSNSNKNSILKKNNSQKNLNNNNKNRTALIQIPKQNSKPRIFLLTRPAKTQLVRIATQSVQHHPQRAGNISNQSQSKIIRIPFLPRSQVNTFSVKSNQINQVLKKDSIVVPLNRNTIQASRLESQKQDSIQGQQEATRYPRTQQVNTKQFLSPPTETSNQLQTQQSVKSTIPQSTVVNNLNLSENKILQTPLTLASMAGIELTGADMSLSQAEMSGAMPPTATVEEINVPVFIDDYLQQVSTQLDNNNTSSNNNNYISNNNNNKGNEIGKVDTIDNFEFDFDLLTEVISEEKEDKELELLEQQQQQQLYEADDDNIEKVKKQQMQKQQLQLQLMLEDILFSNNDNINNNSNESCKSNNNINNNNTTTTSNNKNNNNNMNNMAVTPDLLDDLVYQDSIFNVAPFNHMSEDILTPEDKSFDFDISSLNSTDFSDMEEAINISHMDNDNDQLFNDCFINSQPPEIMFSAPTLSQSQSAKLSQEISEAEPTIAPDMMHYPSISVTSEIAAASGQPCEMTNDAISSYTSQFFEEHTMDSKDIKPYVNPLKRNGTLTTKHMEEKRLKLRLDTKRCRETDVQKYELNTPNVIKFILQNDESIDIMGPADNSMDTIYHRLISTSPSIKSEEIDDTTNDFSPPNTPYSVNSISNQTNFTGFMNTAPNSPASSIATTSNTSVTNKRGRGRPAKLHSDMPDLSQIQHLSETDQKKLLERAKNNEASRKSRLKHKERDNALEIEENALRLRHNELDSDLQKLRKIEKKLQEALRAQHFQLKSERY